MSVVTERSSKDLARWRHTFRGHCTAQHDEPRAHSRLKSLQDCAKSRAGGAIREWCDAETFKLRPGVSPTPASRRRPAPMRAAATTSTTRTRRGDSQPRAGADSSRVAATPPPKSSLPVRPPSPPDRDDPPRLPLPPPCESCLARWAGEAALAEDDARAGTASLLAPAAVAAPPAPRGWEACAPSSTARFTLCDVAARDGRDGRAVWLRAHGVVYDVTPFLSIHPGGRGSILRHAGGEASEDFDFHGAEARKLWGQYAVGRERACEGAAGGAGAGGAAGGCDIT